MSLQRNEPGGVVIPTGSGSSAAYQQQADDTTRPCEHQAHLGGVQSLAVNVPQPSNNDSETLVILDRVVIITAVALAPQLVSAISQPRETQEFLVKALQGDIRKLKWRPGQHRGRSCWRLRLDLLTYGGIRVILTLFPGSQRPLVKIDCNLLTLLFGHNGRVLTQSQFAQGLTILRALLAPLLAHYENPDHLIPGLIRGQHSRAYFSYVEIFLQVADPDLELLRVMRSLKHPSHRSPLRVWEGESLLAGSKNSALRIGVYRKVPELLARKKVTESDLEGYEEVLRLEAKLMGTKSIKYLGNHSNTETIDGQERIVSFTPANLIAAHRSIFSELRGVYLPDERGLPNDEKLARQIALVAHHTNRPLHSLLAAVATHIGKVTSAVRNASLDEMARLSPFRASELLSDASYATQPYLEIPELEGKLSSRRQTTEPDPRILNVYSAGPGRKPRTRCA